MPKTQNEWLQIARDFDSTRQFPNLGGAIDGKHVAIVQPPGSGSYFFNYKGYFSIVLLAVANSNLEFIYVDLGKNGRVSDGGVIEDTAFNKKLLAKRLHLPNSTETAHDLPFVFVADEAFPLSEHLLKPFSRRELTYERKIFNYRLSRARSVVENAFGVMANRFRIFHTAINLDLWKTEIIVMACCVLHNFLRRRCTSTYTCVNSVDREGVEENMIYPGEWRSDPPRHAFDSLDNTRRKRSSDEGKQCRQRYADYFGGIGKVPWQDRMVQKNFSASDIAA